MILVEELALFTWFPDLRWVEGYDSMMYHVSWGNMCYLLACNALDETRVTTRKRFLGRTCVVYLIVRLSVGRGLRQSVIFHVTRGNLRYLLACKALDETRVTTRKCFLSRACVVYLIVRPSLGRGFRLDDVSCILGGATCAMCLLVRPWVRRELWLENVSYAELVLFT